MVRLAVSVNLSTPPEPTRNLAKSFKGVNDYVTGVNVRCAICRLPGKDNSRLVRGRKRTVCAECRRAGAE